MTGRIGSRKAAIGNPLLTSSVRVLCAAGSPLPAEVLLSSGPHMIIKPQSTALACSGINSVPER